MNNILAIGIGLAVFLAGILFEVKQAVRDQQHHLARLESRIVARQDSLRVLKAEWSHLNQPERLADLAARHLDLQPLKPDQTLSLRAWAGHQPHPLSGHNKIQAPQPGMEPVPSGALTAWSASPPVPESGSWRQP